MKCVCGLYVHPKPRREEEKKSCFGCFGGNEDMYNDSNNDNTQSKVEEVEELVEEVEELESKRAELADELVIKVAKGSAVAYIRWVEKMEAVQDISGCGDNQKVKYSADSLTGKALTWWNSEVMTRGHEAAIGMTWEDLKALMSHPA
ncbi:hypothetical protein Tco_0461993 [Tanacetum coccineum]